jgi:hypothetical protein
MFILKAIRMNYQNAQIVYGIDEEHPTYRQQLKIVTGLLDNDILSFEDPGRGESVDVRIDRISKHRPKEKPLF